MSDPAATLETVTLLRLVPGADRDYLVNELRTLSMELGNMRSSNPVNWQRDYLAWAAMASRKLSTHVSHEDVDRLVLTRRHWAIQGAVGANPADIAPVIEAEFDQQIRLLDDAHEDLRREIARWSPSSPILVADSSAYIEHPQKIEAWDLGDLLKEWEQPIHLVVPILVVDELDGLKRSGNAKTRWRAGYTLAVLDRLLTAPRQRGLLRAADFTPLASGGLPRGDITVEIAFDPPGHRRLPINDDELVDRALTVQTLAGRAVTFLTYDTGQAMRARAAGLKAIKLEHQLGDEPER